MIEGGETYSRAVALSDDVVTGTIADVETPSEVQKQRFLRDAIEEGDRDISEALESPAEEVFARLRAALPITSCK